MVKRGFVRFGLFLTFALPVLGRFVAEPALADPDMAGFPPPGQLVAVDGHQRHLFCTGTGTPTVILEEGAGGASLNWVWIQRMVAATTRVCSHDRPGYGWSDPSDTPRDAETVGRELDALLKSAGENGPFIVVGHSLGGAYARMFAAQQRDNIVGLVLVDATSPSAFATMTEVGLPPPQKGAVATFLTSSGALFQAAHRIGLSRLTIDEDLNDFPPDAVPVMRAFLLSDERARTAVRELNSVSDTIRQISPLGTVGPMPVTVIAADRWIDKDPDVATTRAEWNKKQQRNWLAISTNSRFLVVAGSDHLSLLSKKEHAAVVSGAIIRMVHSLKHQIALLVGTPALAPRINRDVEAAFVHPTDSREPSPRSPDITEVTSGK
jgi:pimeloyl-ACP methyl ester carboxylesterase